MQTEILNARICEINAGKILKLGWSLSKDDLNELGAPYLIRYKMVRAIGAQLKALF